MTFVLLLLLLLLLAVPSLPLLVLVSLPLLVLASLLLVVAWARPRPDEYDSAAMSARRLNSAILGSCLMSSGGQSAFSRRNAIRC